MSLFLLAQIIGFCAIIVSLCIFQSNKRPKMLKLAVLSCLLNVLHFLMLGAYTGAAIKFIAAFRGYAYMKWVPSPHHIWVLYGFSAITVLTTLITWQGYVSLLAMMGSLTAGYAVWHTKPSQIRKWAWLPPPFWFAYCLFTGSISGMVLEILMVSSLIIGEYRHDFHHKKHHDRHRLARTY